MMRPPDTFLLLFRFPFSDRPIAAAAREANFEQISLNRRLTRMYGILMV